MRAINTSMCSSQFAILNLQSVLLFFRQSIVIAVIIFVYAHWATSAWAGIPESVPDEPTRNLILTDASQLRYGAISFFLVVLLLSALVIRLLWNWLAKDFRRLPKISYFKSLGVVAAWGMLFLVVLTMIATTREMMTPGVWEKQGLLYKLPSNPPAQETPKNIDSDNQKDSRQSLPESKTPAYSYNAILLLLFGWLLFLYDNLHKISCNPAAMATGAVVLLLFTGLAHTIGRWWIGPHFSTAGAEKRSWRFRWTLSVVILVVVMFAAGFSAVGLARHIGWLLTTPNPITMNHTPNPYQNL
jgi:hypothetical protein